MNKDYIQLENENIVRTSDSLVRKRKIKENQGPKVALEKTVSQTDGHH